MNDHSDDTRIRELLQLLPKRSIPSDLVAAIEAETLFKRHWWDSDAFRIRWMPALVGVATAVGALWLSKSQQNPRPQALLPVAIAPRRAPAIQHALLTPPQPLNSEKGESREN